MEYETKVLLMGWAINILLFAVICGGIAPRARIERWKGWVFGGLLGPIGLVIMLVIWVVRSGKQ